MTDTETRETAISSNHFSLDLQCIDAMEWLRLNHPDAYHAVSDQFPEYLDHKMDSPLCTFDTDAMGVDPEWSSWLVDAIEQTDLVWWEEGEPWVAEAV